MISTSRYLFINYETKQGDISGICTKSGNFYDMAPYSEAIQRAKHTPMWIELLCFHLQTWLKLAWYGPVIVPQRNPTLPWADIQCKVKWDRRATKPQYRWSFPQINLHTVTIFAYFFTRATVNRILKRHAATGSLVPGKSSGAPERQHLGKTVHCWGWSDRIVSWVLGPWRRGWEICTEWGLVAQRLTTDSCPVVTGHIDPQRSPCWLPTTVVSAWSGRTGGGTWQWPTGSMSSSVMSRDSNFTR